MTKTYTKVLAECLGTLVSNIAQTYDVGLDEVMDEVWCIINAVPNPQGLFEEKWLKE